MLYVATLQEWRQQNKQITEHPLSIIDMDYNKTCRKLYVVLSRSEYEKQESCVLLQLALVGDTLANPLVLCDS